MLGDDGTSIALPQPWHSRGIQRQSGNEKKRPHDAQRRHVRGT
jgi:hypothetical protein